MLILDRATVHKSKKIRDFLTDNLDVKLIWLPKGPTISKHDRAVLENKHVLLVSEYYAMFTIMNNAVSQYFGTKKFKLDVVNYIFRNPARMFTNF